MDNKIVFEKYGIDFSDEDFEGVSKETLQECENKVREKINYLRQEKGENNGSK